MLKSIHSSVVFDIVKNTRRSFLSEAYKCTEIWNARLQSPVLQRINVEPLYYDLKQKFQQQGKVSAIDIDVFANKLTNEGLTEELADLAHKLRMTEETSNSLDSLGHALIRLYLDQNHIKELLDVLNNRLTYGVFLDYFTANLALDKFIRAKDYKSAARIATFVMLQEEFENPITKYLSLYACWKFLDNMQPFEEPKPVVEAPVVDKKKKKPEEIKIRLKFIRNEYFDDHFDLVDSKLLVGKTLIMIGKTIDGSLGNSVQIVGYALYQKYAEGSEFCSKLKGGVHKNVPEMVKNILNEVSGQEENEAFKQFNEHILKLQGATTTLIDDDMDKEICKLANDAVAKFESVDIDQQAKMYEKWLVLREQKLAEELDRLNRAQRLADIEKMTKEMVTEEQKLWFFENEEKIDLQIDSKKVFYPKRWFGKKKKPRSVDAEYVPPEVR